MEGEGAGEEERKKIFGSQELSWKKKGEHMQGDNIKGMPPSPPKRKLQRQGKR